MSSNPPQTLDIKLLHGELLCSPDTTEVWGALIQAQAKMEPPQRTKTAKVKGRTKAGVEYEYEYKYAPLEAIIAALRPAFAEYGLGYQQFLARAGNNPVLRTIIIHKSAQWTAIDYPIFWDTSKGQQGFQGGVPMRGEEVSVSPRGSLPKMTTTPMCLTVSPRPSRSGPKA
jgi:hypothetical protein